MSGQESLFPEDPCERDQAGGGRPPAVNWADLVRVDARLRPGQDVELDALVRRLKVVQRRLGESGRTPRITTNTLLRLAVDLLVHQGDRVVELAAGATTEEQQLSRLLTATSLEPGAPVETPGPAETSVPPAHAGPDPTADPDPGSPDPSSAQPLAAVAPALSGPDSESRTSRVESSGVRGPRRGPARPPGREAGDRVPGRRSQADVYRGARFRAIAAVVDAETVYLPGGERHPWQARHLGELAALVPQFRLGWGGGRTLPERGEVWLYPGALERLGLPATIEIDPMLMAREQAQAARVLFDDLSREPAVADAVAAGWELAGGRVERRTRLKHPQLLRAGAHLVPVTWTPLERYPELIRDIDAESGEFVLPDPGELADRLDEFARRSGVAYRVSPGVTGLDLIDHTHPEGDAISLPRWVGAELPPWMPGRAEALFTQVEGNFSWWRRFEDLLAEEKACTYVHAYDHRSHFLNPWSSVLLGLTGLTHLTGDEARWSGKDERAAYYRVDKWDWPHWQMPDPATGLHAFVEGTVWVTAHTLKQLERLETGFTDSLTFHEAWTWTRQGRYLEAAGKLLRQARAQGSGPVADTVKQVYSATVQKLAATEHRDDYHLWRPDWRDMVVAASRTAIVSMLLDGERNGRYPLVVDRDTVVYASNEADPQAAWPGRPEKYQALAGGWRPIGSGRLADWAPTALGRGVGIWNYRAHMERLAAPGRA